MDEVLNHWNKDFRTMVPRVGGLKPWFDVPLRERLSCYKGRFTTIVKWTPEIMGSVTPRGFVKRDGVNAQSFPERKEKGLRFREIVFNPDQRQSPYPNYRYGTNYLENIALWDDTRGAPRRTLEFLAKEGVGVYLVILPALAWEGWENNTYFYREWTNFLAQMQVTYPNIRQVLDMNRNFEHSFQSIELYTDLEHFTPEASVTVTRSLASMMVLDNIRGGDSVRSLK
jgi:hypothetical protein